MDVGSGAGHHAVHLAQAHGARVTGIELSPTQYERAVCAHAEVGGVSSSEQTDRPNRGRGTPGRTHAFRIRTGGRAGQRPVLTGSTEVLAPPARGGSPQAGHRE
ncbi:SAM-dependent methyltransferase [Streptomyces mutabilis]|uniref:SAM-dependent methyltransferase n=1 Tax=Streptomyces mutabilis TaxID=67332 RepID=UPI0036B7AB10